MNAQIHCCILFQTTISENSTQGSTPQELTTPKATPNVTIEQQSTPSVPSTTTSVELPGKSQPTIIVFGGGIINQF